MTELDAYNAVSFDLSALDTPLPLDSEPHVDFWRAWAGEGPAWESLCRHLPQLRFPIREGISKSDDYRAATLRGEEVEGLAGATGLSFDHPQALRLVIHPTPAGEVPVILPRGRRDFETVVRALAHRGEPVPLLATMGACTVKGFNDWERIRAYKARWLEEGHDEEEWGSEFGRLAENKAAYQDRFLILSDGDYSDISAATLGLDPSLWQAQSVEIRMRHECTHYVTLRLLGGSRNNALDELVCDFVGFSSTLGRFSADLFLRGMGLENAHAFRPGGRLEQYAGELSPLAFATLSDQVRGAARTLERFDEERPRTNDAMLDEMAAIAAICSGTIESLRGEDLVTLLDVYARQRSRLRQRARD
jgi:hypothetical protein